MLALSRRLKIGGDPGCQSSLSCGAKHEQRTRGRRALPAGKEEERAACEVHSGERDCCKDKADLSWGGD